jgi:hypothetical protein
MLTVTQYKLLKTMLNSYWASLNIAEVKAEYAMRGLLTRNKKLKKGGNSNWGLELLPANLSPMNLCAGAGQCRYSCLAFSGIGNLCKSKKIIGGEELSVGLKSKARRTYLLINDPEFFRAILKVEILRNYQVALLENKTFGLRLNVTSDVDWSDFMQDLPDICAYDYTKVWSRKSTKNCKLTFSVSELTSKKDILEKLKQGENVAVVFSGEKPKTYLGYPVIDGDENDDRYDDYHPAVIGLKMKVTVGGNDKASKFLKGMSKT